MGKDTKLRKLLFGYDGDDNMLPVTGGYLEELEDDRNKRIKKLEDQFNYPSLDKSKLSENVEELRDIISEQRQVILALLDELGYEYVKKEVVIKLKSKKKVKEKVEKKVSKR